MKSRLEVSIALAIALTVTACATAPGMRTAEGHEPTCHSLAIEIAKAEKDRQLALAEGQNAWRKIIPVAVAMQYSKSVAGVDAAQHHIEKARATARAIGCVA